MKLFFILTFIVSQISWAAHEKAKFVAAGFNFSCMASATKVQCFGKNDYGGSQVIEGFKNIKSLTAGQGQVCVVDDEGIWCWGNEYSIDAPRIIENPYHVMTQNNETTTCSLHELGVTCWNTKVTLHLDEAKNAERFSSDGFRGCGIFQRKVKCYEPYLLPNSNPTLPVPSDIVDPIDIVVGFGSACVIDGQKVRCWGYKWGQKAPPYRLKNPRQLFMGNYYLCVLDDDGAKCWGHPSVAKVPPLKNPRTIAAGNGHACAVDDEGVKCWGGNSHGQTDVPLDF